MDKTQLSDIYNYQPVDAMLATAGQPTEAQLAAVARDGFAVVINLALHDVPRYSLPDEPGLVQSLGMQYVHIPVAFTAPQESDLLKFFAAMEMHQGEKIFLHCAANMRVSAFLGLYNVIKQGQSYAEAFALLDNIWDPDLVWSEFIIAMLDKHRA